MSKRAGRMLSPFANDPFALVALAFKNLYPDREYLAYFVPDMEGEGGDVYGATTFPEDGTPPVVEVSGEIPIAAGIEIFAHELAHVATPEDQEHGEAWNVAFARRTRSNTYGVGSGRTVKRIYKRLFGTLTGSLIERENRPRKERGF